VGSAQILRANDLSRSILAKGWQVMSTVLPIWGAVLLVCLSAWSIGARLVVSKQPLVALLAGWSLFLVLCSVPWIAGFSAYTVRPLFWIFYAVGIWSVVKGRQWTEAVVTLIVTGAVTMVLLHRCYAYEGAYVFGAHGTDLWGYVQVADWLYGHSTRQLPDLVTTPMRYNWTGYVLATRERPLIYESMACLGSSTGLDAVKAYMALPVALMVSSAEVIAADCVRLPPTASVALPADSPVIARSSLSVNITNRPGLLTNSESTSLPALGSCTPRADEVTASDVAVIVPVEVCRSAGPETAGVPTLRVTGPATIVSRMSSLESR
jgi:hypothetical protein